MNDNSSRHSDSSGIRRDGSRSLGQHSAATAAIGAPQRLHLNRARLSDVPGIQQDVEAPTLEELQRWRSRMGPKLRALVRSQQDKHPPVRESYSWEHFERLRKFEYRRPFDTREKVRCVDVHPRTVPKCARCTTCHFCRQKTVDEKTFCPCAGGVNGRRGTARGVWCGNCLWLRMGQNLHEILPLCEQGLWRCPACQDLCNCSGATCSRYQKGLEPTEQLHHEAVGKGFKSAAHYLVETLLQEDAVARPMGAMFTGPPPKRRKVEEAPQTGPHARAFQGARQRKERVQQLVQQRLAEQFRLMGDSLGSPAAGSITLEAAAAAHDVSSGMPDADISDDEDVDDDLAHLTPESGMPRASRNLSQVAGPSTGAGGAVPVHSSAPGLSPSSHNQGGDSSWLHGDCASPTQETTLAERARAVQNRQPLPSFGRRPRGRGWQQGTGLDTAADVDPGSAGEGAWDGGHAGLASDGSAPWRRRVAPRQAMAAPAGTWSHAAAARAAGAPQPANSSARHPQTPGTQAQCQVSPPTFRHTPAETAQRPSSAAASVAPGGNPAAFTDDSSAGHPPGLDKHVASKSFDQQQNVSAPVDGAGIHHVQQASGRPKQGQPGAEGAGAAAGAEGTDKGLDFSVRLLLHAAANARCCVQDLAELRARGLDAPEAVEYVLEPYKLYGPEFSFIQDLDCFLSEYDEGFLIPLQLGTPVDAPEDSRVDHRFLRCALDVLLAAAELKDHDDVRWSVARRLFCKEPFLNFARSDPAARSFLLRAAFDLLEVADRRRILVDDIIQEILHLLQCLIAEHIALHEWRKNAETHFRDGDALDIGPFRRKPPWTELNRVEAEALLEFGEKSSEHLLTKVLTWTAQAIMGADMASTSNERMLPLFGEPILDLLDDKLPISQHVRTNVLHLIRLLVKSLRDGGTSASMGDLDDYDAMDMLNDMRRKLGQKLQEVAVPRLEAALVQYPYRSAARDPSAAILAQPLALDLDRTIADVKELALPTLGRVYGLLVMSGQIPWRDLIAYAMLPYGEGQFWTNASQHYRTFAVQFIAYALEAFPAIARSHMAKKAQLLGIWLRAMLDFRERESCFLLTDATCLVAGELFRDASFSASALRQDRSGHVRAQLVQCVFSAAANHAEWRDSLAGVLGGLADVLAKRSAEKERSTLRTCQAWQQAATTLALALMSGSGISICKCPPHMASCNCIGQAILGQVIRWAGSAGMQLQCWWLAQAEQAQLDLADPAAASDLLVQARRLLLGKTAFSHVSDTAALLSGHSFFQQSHPGRTDPPLAVMSLLQGLLATVIEVPQGAELAGPADLALYDAVAKALLGERPSVQPAEPDEQLPGREQLRRMLHYLVGTQLRRHLENVQHGRGERLQRSAVNTLRFVSALLARPELRSNATAPRTFLPPLLRPILELLSSSGSAAEAPLAVKGALYELLMTLGKDSEGCPWPTLTEDDATAGRPVLARMALGRSLGPLQHCQTLPNETWQAALRIVLSALTADVTAYIGSLAPPDAAAAPSSTAATQAGLQGMRDSLFTLLGPPRPLDATIRALEGKSLIQVPQRYKLPAHDIIDLALQAPSLATAQQAPFRPVDFKWTVARLAMSLLTGLASSGPAGAAWAAKAGKDIAAIMARSPVLQRVLREQLGELAAALAESGSPLRLPAALSFSQMRAGSAGQIGRTGVAAAQQRQPLVEVNRTPGQTPPHIKQEAAEHKVLSCLADLGKLPGQPLLLTITGRLLSAQLRQTKSGGCIQMKLEDDSLRGNAAFSTVAVLFLHNTDRLWPEMQATMHPSCPLVACTLTAVVRLQSRDRAGPIALKSTPGSHVILQPSGTPPQSMHTAHLEGSGHAADSAQAGSVLPNQAQADSTPLALAAASAAPPGQLTQASEVVHFGHALGAAAHVPVQPQQILRCSEPMMQSNAGSKQHYQMQAGSSRGRRGDHPQQEYISCSSGLQLHAAQNMCADAVGCVPDQMPYRQHSVLQQASRQPQPAALQGVTGLTSGSLPAHHHSAAPSAPVDVGHGGANVTRFHSCSAQHSPSQMSSVACTGATQYYTLPRNSTEMPASSLPGTQPPSEGPQDAGHAAAVHGQDVQALQLRSAQSPAAAESVHAAGHLPRAALGETAGPSSCQADVVVSNPVVAGQQRFQEMVCKLLLMGFERPEVHKALLVAHREGLDGGDATLLRAVECLTQSRDSAALLS